MSTSNNPYQPPSTSEAPAAAAEGPRLDTRRPPTTRPAGIYAVAPWFLLVGNLTLAPLASLALRFPGATERDASIARLCIFLALGILTVQLVQLQRFARWASVSLLGVSSALAVLQALSLHGVGVSLARAAVYCAVVLAGNAAAVAYLVRVRARCLAFRREQDALAVQRYADKKFRGGA